MSPAKQAPEGAAASAAEAGATRRCVLGVAMLAAAAPSAAARAEAFAEPAVRQTLGWARAGDGQRIRFARSGASGRLRLVFIHGWTCDKSYWNGQVEAFSTDHDVLTLDLVGHGDSDKDRRTWSMEQLGDDVARAVEVSGSGPAVIVGHSMGGPVAIEAARRLGPTVKGVVTIDILTTLKPRKPSGSVPLTAETYRTEGEKMIRTGMFQPGTDPRLVDRIATAMTSGAPQVALGLSDALNRYDAKAGLKALGATPLTMIDAGSREVDVAGLREVHPNVRLFLIEHVGHFVMIDDPATFNGLLRTETALMAGLVRAL